MSISLNLKKGYDIMIAGDPGPCPEEVSFSRPTVVALTADDFPGITPKPIVHEGDTVKAGDPIIVDKHFTQLAIVAPVNGTIKAINRGERRKLINIVIETSTETSDFKAKPLGDVDAETAKSQLLASGLWAMMRQRPYDIVPDVNAVPRDIFISAIDCYPLAGDRTSLYINNVERLAAGVKLLSKLTSGKVYLARRPNTLPDVADAEMIDVNGPCPAGNPGVIAANIAPVNKGEVIWCIDIETLDRIGALAVDGTPHWSTVVAITGSEVQQPGWCKTIIGASVKTLLDGRLKEAVHHQRIISGNVLTGTRTDLDGFLRLPYRQITVIPEGDDCVEFMGWASLSPAKMSRNRSFLGKLFGRKTFNPDARLLGGHRAMIMSGEYQSVFPMDIYPEYLLKAIMSKDIEKMEQLGIYEVAPEDFAVAEHLCSSKMPLQQIVAQGLEYLRKELQ